MCNIPIIIGNVPALDENNASAINTTGIPNNDLPPGAVTSGCKCNVHLNLSMYLGGNIRFGFKLPFYLMLGLMPHCIVVSNRPT